MSNCCDPKPSNRKKFDPIFYGSVSAVALFYILHVISNIFGFTLPFVQTFSLDVYTIMNTMWWGLLVGVIFVGVVGSIPRELMMSALGKGGTIKGLLRATAAGVLLDLCSHGVLMVGAKLYERGASLGQVMAFLIASPWNSLSLMLILWAMIGLKWMLIFLVLSMVIGFISGVIFDILVKRGTLEGNSNSFDLPEDFHFKSEAKKSFKTADKSVAGFVRMMKSGAHDARIVIKWLMFGVVLAATVRSVMSEDMFATYFGATLLGLGLTALAATVIEVCSEGSVPFAADIFNKAEAKGNSFAFLMAGVSTDYTEIMVLKETFGGWKRALFLPLITLPQILVWAFAINQL
jgi:uncharacterized membrane protein YraQ (UPF0718 family)